MRHGKLRFVRMKEARKRHSSEADHVVNVIRKMARSLISGVHRQIDDRRGEANHLVNQGLSCCSRARLDRLIVRQELSKVEPHLQKL